MIDKTIQQVLGEIDKLENKLKVKINSLVSQ